MYLHCSHRRGPGMPLIRTPSQPHRPYRALLIGHEHVTQLAHFVQQCNQPNLKNNDAFTMFFHAKENMSLRDIGSELFLLDTIKPHIVFLEIGSHDLAKKTWDVQKVIKNVWKLALHILNHHKVLRVFISEIHHRKPTEKYPMCDNFYQKCLEYNDELEKICKTSELRNNFVIIAPHKYGGHPEKWQEVLELDGFHLKNEGIINLLKVIEKYLTWSKTAVSADLSAMHPGGHRK